VPVYAGIQTLVCRANVSTRDAHQWNVDYLALVLIGPRQYFRARSSSQEWNLENPRWAGAWHVVGS